MSFTVRIVSAGHRPDVFAEIELDGELVAEAYVEGGLMMIALAGVEGEVMWAAPANDLLAAVERARVALTDSGLLT